MVGEGSEHTTVRLAVYLLGLAVVPLSPQLHMCQRKNPEKLQGMQGLPPKRTQQLLHIRLLGNMRWGEDTVGALLAHLYTQLYVFGLP